MKALTKIKSFASRVSRLASRVGATSCRVTALLLALGFALGAALSTHAAADVSTLVVSGDWSSREPGDAITVGEKTYYYGTNAFSNMDGAIAAMDATTATISLQGNAKLGDTTAMYVKHDLVIEGNGHTINRECTGKGKNFEILCNDQYDLTYKVTFDNVQFKGLTSNLSRVIYFETNVDIINGSKFDCYQFYSYKGTTYVDATSKLNTETSSSSAEKGEDYQVRGKVVFTGDSSFDPTSIKTSDNNTTAQLYTPYIDLRGSTIYECSLNLKDYANVTAYARIIHDADDGEKPRSITVDNHSLLEVGRQADGTWLTNPAPNGVGFMQLAKGDTVTITNGSVLRGSTYLQNAGTFTVSGSTVKFGTTIENSGTMTLENAEIIAGSNFAAGGGTKKAGNFTNSGELILKGNENSFMVLEDGKLTNTGTITVSGANGERAWVPASIIEFVTWEEGSTLSLVDGSDVAINCDFSNNISVESGSYLQVNGNVTLDAGESITLGYADDALLNVSGNLDASAGSITVDMTGATEDEYTIIFVSDEGTSEYGSNLSVIGGAYKLSQDGKNLVAKKFEAVAAVTFDGKTTYYDSLQNAINAVSAKGAIIQLLNEDVGKIPYIGKCIGYTIKGLEETYTKAVFSTQPSGNEITGQTTSGITFENMNFVDTVNRITSPDITFINCKFTGNENGVRDGNTSGGKWTFDGCSFEQRGDYAFHFGYESETGSVSFKDCYIGGWASSNKQGGGITFTNCVVDVGLNADAGINLTGSPSVYTDCRFTQAALAVEGVRPIALTELNNCIVVADKDSKEAVEGTSALDIISTSIKKGKMGASAFVAIDAAKSEGKYTTGQFVSSKSSLFATYMSAAPDLGWYGDTCGKLVYDNAGTVPKVTALGTLTGTIKVPSGTEFSVSTNLATFTSGTKLYVPYVQGSEALSNWVAANIPAAQAANVTVAGTICSVTHGGAVTSFYSIADAQKVAVLGDTITLFAGDESAASVYLAGVNFKMTDGKIASVYGGNTNGGETVTGNVAIEIAGGTVAAADSGNFKGGIYGGGICSTVDGDTSVKVTGGSVTGKIVGGGYITRNGSKAVQNAVVTGNASVEIGVAGGETTTINGDVVGGGYGHFCYGSTPSRVLGSTTVSIVNAQINGAVSGGASGTQGNQSHAEVAGNITLTISDSAVTGNIAGGGMGLDDNSATGATVMAPVITTTLTNVTMSSGKTLYGGYRYVNTDAKALTGDVYLNINGGTYYYVYGGSHNDNPPADTRVSVSNVHVAVTGGTFAKNFFGAGNTQTTKGDVEVAISGGTFSGSVYFGGNGDNTAQGVVDGNVTATISGGVFNKSVNGSYANIGGRATVSVSGGTFNGALKGRYSEATVIASGVTLNLDGAADALGGIQNFDAINVNADFMLKSAMSNCGTLTVAASKTLSVTNGLTLTISNLVNNGTIAYDLSQATALTNKLIEITGAEEKTPADFGTIELANPDYHLEVVGNDLYAILNAAQVISFDGMTTNSCDTLAEAFAAVQNGETILVLKDNDEVVSVPPTATRFSFDANGKTLTGDVAAADGYVFVPNGEGGCEYGALVAKNGSTPYLSLVEAIADANDGDRVMLLRDIAVDTAAVKPVIVDFGTNTVFGSLTVTTNVTLSGATGGLAVGDGTNAVTVAAGVTVKVIDGFYRVTDGNLFAGDGTAVLQGGTYSKDPSAWVDNGFEAIDNKDGTWTVGVKVETGSETKENEATLIAKPTTYSAETNDVPSEVKTKIEEPIEVAGEPTTAAKEIAAETEVEGVRLTTVETTNVVETVTNVVPAGVQAVVDAAKVKAAGDQPAFVTDIEGAKQVEVKVDVKVTPTDYSKSVPGSSVGVAAFALEPIATVTAKDASGAVLSTEENVKVTNDMIDPDQKIMVSIFTGFEPQTIVHVDDAGEVIEVFTAGQIVYNPFTGVAQVPVSHFSDLIATEAASVCRIVETGVCHPTLAAAFAQVAADQTVQLLCNVDESVAATSPTLDFTLDLASYNYANDQSLTVKGNITVVGDGNNKFDFATVYISSSGTLTLANGISTSCSSLMNMGTIAVDVTDIAGCYKVIDFTGAGTVTLADYGAVETVGIGSEYYTFAVDENDLWLAKTIAVIDEEKFLTVNDAIEAAKATDTIELYGAGTIASNTVLGAQVMLDVSDGSLTIPEDITLTVNGTLDTYDAAFTNKGVLVINAGSTYALEGENKIGSTKKNCRARLTRGSVTETAEDVEGVWVRSYTVNSNSEITVNAPWSEGDEYYLELGAVVTDNDMVAHTQDQVFAALHAAADDVRVIYDTTKKVYKAVKTWKVTIDGVVATNALNEAALSFTAPIVNVTNGWTNVVCTGWTGSTNGATVAALDPATTVAFKITADSVIDWHYQTNYWFTAKIAEGSDGTIVATNITVQPNVAVDISGTWANADDSIKLYATPAEHYHFKQWNLESRSFPSNPLKADMYRPYAFTAEIPIDTFKITIDGQVATNIAWGSTYTATSPMVNVTNAYTNIVCTGWTGNTNGVATSGTEASFEIKVDKESTFNWLYQTNWYVNVQSLPMPLAVSNTTDDVEIPLVSYVKDGNTVRAQTVEIYTNADESAWYQCLGSELTGEGYQEGPVREIGTLTAPAWIAWTVETNHLRDARILRGGVEVEKYLHLKDAIASDLLQDGDTIELLRDAKVMGGEQTITKSITLDLNGWTLAATNTVSPESSSGAPLVVGAETAEPAFTLKDSVGTGKVTGGNSNWRGGGVLVQKGSMTFESGTIEANAYYATPGDANSAACGGAIFVSTGATVTMKDGAKVVANKSLRYNEGEAHGGAFGVAGTLVIEGGLVSNNTAKTSAGFAYVLDGGKLTINGGTIVDNTPDGEQALVTVGGATALITAGEFSFDPTTWTDKDSCGAKTGDRWTVVKAVAKIERTQVRYPTVDTAYAAAEAGDTITLMTNTVATLQPASGSIPNGVTVQGVAEKTTVTTGFDTYEFAGQTFQNIKFACAGDALASCSPSVTFANCDFAPQGDALSFDDFSSGTVLVTNCTITGKVYIPTDAQAHFVDTVFAGKGATDSHYIQFQHDAAFDRCTFADEYADKSGIRSKNITVALNGCALTNGSPCKLTDVFMRERGGYNVLGFGVIDGVTNSVGLYTNGTVVANQQTLIDTKIAPEYAAQLVAGETDVYTIVPAVAQVGPTRYGTLSNAVAVAVNTDNVITQLANVAETIVLTNAYDRFRLATNVYAFTGAVTTTADDAAIYTEEPDSGVTQYWARRMVSVEPQEVEGATYEVVYTNAVQTMPCNVWSNDAIRAESVTVRYIANEGYVFEDNTLTNEVANIPADANPTVVPTGKLKTAYPIVAKVGEDKFFYALDQAVAAAQDNDTITILTNINLSAGQSLMKSLTVDLNGFAIARTNSSWNGYVFVTSGKTVTVKDSSVAKTGKITGCKSTNGGAAIQVSSGAFILESGSVIGNSYKMKSMQPIPCGGAIFVQASATATIKEGAVVALNVAGETGADLDHNGGAFGVAGTLNIEGGVFSNNVAQTSGGVAYVMDGGRLNVTGGLFVENYVSNNTPDKALSLFATQSAAATCFVSNGWFDVDPWQYAAPGRASVYIAESNLWTMADAVCKIDDHRYFSISNAVELSAAPATDIIELVTDTDEDVVLRTLGQSFNLATNTFAFTGTVTTPVEGAIVHVEPQDGYTTYRVMTAIAQIGDIKFALLSDAAKAAKDGDTIKLIRDCKTDDVTVTNDVTIALEGKMLTIEDTLVNSGKITLANSVAGEGGLTVTGNINVMTNGFVDLRGLAYGPGGLLKQQGGHINLYKDSTVRFMSAWDGNSANALKAYTDGFFGTLEEGAKAITDKTYTWSESAQMFVVDGAVAKATTVKMGKEFVDSFDTVAEAVSAVKAAETVTIVSNCTETSVLTIGKELTFDIDGYEVTLAGVTVNANAALKNSKLGAGAAGSGWLKMTGKATIADGATLDMSMMPMGQYWHGIHDESVAAGGFDIKAGGEVLFIADCGKYEYQGQTFVSPNFMAANTNGTFYGQIPEAGAKVSFAGGKTWISEGTFFTNAASQVKMALTDVTRVGYEGTCDFIEAFDTPAVANAVAKDGDTLALIADASADGVKVEKDITLDLNGQTLVIAEAFTNAADVVITNGLATAGGLSVNGRIAVESGTLDASALKIGVGGLIPGQNGGLDIAKDAKFVVMNAWAGSTPNYMAANRDGFLYGADGALVQMGSAADARLYTYSAAEQVWIGNGQVAKAEILSLDDQGQPMEFVETYDTLAAAWAAVKEGGLVSLLGAATTDGITLGKNATINLNGKDLTNGTCTVAGTVAITNGVAAGGIVNVGTVTVNGTLDMSTLTWGTGGFIPGEKGALAISATGTVKMGSPDGKSPNWMAANLPSFLEQCATDATLVIDGVTYTKGADGVWALDGAVAKAEIAGKSVSGADLGYLESYTTLQDAVNAVTNHGTVTLVANCDTATIKKPMVLDESSYAATNLTLQLGCALKFAQVTGITANELRATKPDLFASLEGGAVVITDKAYVYIAAIDAFIKAEYDWEAVAIVEDPECGKRHPMVFPTFAKALESVATNGTIWVLRDVTNEGFTVDYSMTIDLVTAFGEGKTLTITNAASKTYGIDISKLAADVTFRGGTIAAGENAGLTRLVQSSAQNLTLDGVEIDGENLDPAKTAYALSLAEGATTLTNATLYLDRADGYALYVSGSGASEGNDVAFVGESDRVVGNIRVHKLTDADVSLALGTVEFTPSSSEATFALEISGSKDDAYITVDQSAKDQFVGYMTAGWGWTSIGGGLYRAVQTEAYNTDTGAFLTLQDAVDQAGAGETIELIKDVTMQTLVVTNTNAFTLDLYGYRLTSDVAVSNANVTIEGGWTGSTLVGDVEMGENAKVSVYRGTYIGRFVGATANLTLDWATVTTPAGEEGAVIEVGGTLAIVNGSRITGDAAVKVTGGTATVSNSVIKADGAGAAIAVVGDADVDVQRGTKVLAPVNSVAGQLDLANAGSAKVTKYRDIDLLAPLGYAWVADKSATDVRTLTKAGATVAGIGEENLIVTKNYDKDTGVNCSVVGGELVVDDVEGVACCGIQVLDTSVLVWFESEADKTYVIQTKKSLSAGEAWVTTGKKLATETTTTFTVDRPAGTDSGYFQVLRVK